MYDQSVTESPEPGEAAPTEDQDPIETLPERAALPDAIDRLIWSWLSRATQGASPIALATSWFDWLSHMAISPGQTGRLAVDVRRQAGENWQRLLLEMAGGAGMEGGSESTAAARGLSALADMHEAWTAWLGEAVHRPQGVSRLHAERVAFSMRQVMELTHPRNFFWTNVDALRATREQAGANLLRGMAHFLEDMRALASGALEPAGRNGASEVGRTLAVTAGKVVYRNRLIELIQYTPQTSEVHAEPVLITPAWIMKYYVLDLSERDSLIQYLVRQGFTVFVISWRNPDEEDRDLSFDDYRRLGVLSAVEAVQALVPGEKLHGVGYCLGGTLLSVAAAGLARDGNDPFATLSLFAAQTDFRDSGELALFIDEAQLAALEAGMEARGYLDGSQMAAAFTSLRARDLIWRRVQTDYMLGRRGELIDLMVWNADTTRMPYRMHSEYLRRFFLNNDFVEGRLVVDGRPAAVSDMRAPIFALGTEKDHVAPWRSVFKIHLFADTDVTFALTNGGHNAGVVSPPGHPRRHHHIHTRADRDPYLAPDNWLQLAEKREGSWWPSWTAWLGERSGAMVPARKPARAKVASNEIALRAPLPAAPGEYVRSRSQT